MHSVLTSPVLVVHLKLLLVRLEAGGVVISNISFTTVFLQYYIFLPLKTVTQVSAGNEGNRTLNWE